MTLGQASRQCKSNRRYEISALRLQMARSTEFRGFGPGDAGGDRRTRGRCGGRAKPSGCPIRVETSAPMSACGRRPLLCRSWLVAAEAIRRSRKAHEGLADDMLVAAAEQFLPGRFRRRAADFVLLAYAPETLWMLPGLWQVIFSLGVFAACRNLPPLAASRGGLVSGDGPWRAWRSRRGACILALGDGASFRDRRGPRGGAACGGAIEANMTDRPRTAQFAYEGLDRASTSAPGSGF